MCHARCSLAPPIRGSEVADRQGGWTVLRWGLKPRSYRVTARPVGPSLAVGHPGRQIGSKARSQSQSESGSGRDRRAHHRSHKATPRDLPGLATALIRSRTTFSCSLLSSSAIAVTHPWFLHLLHSSVSTAMAWSRRMPTIGRAGTDPRSQDADTDNARSVTSDRSRQIDTGMYVLPSQSTWGRTSTGPQAVTTIPNNAARQREAIATSRILPLPPRP